MQPYLAPWMIESAHRYCEAAKHLQYLRNMLPIAQINSALGMEILLKSFLSKPNGNVGQANETYKLDDNAIKAAHEYLKAADRIPDYRKEKPYNKHDLLTLFYAIPEPIRQRVHLDRHEHRIEIYRDVFTKSRYRYENNATDGPAPSDTLIHVLDELIVNAVDLYRELACEDRFIQCYSKPEVEVGMFLTEADLDPQEDENRPPRPPMPS